MRTVRMPAPSILVYLGLALCLAACRGQHIGPGEPSQARLPEKVVASRTTTQTQARQALGMPGASAKQILFGDLHVHTTFSPDAFALSLPIIQGEGVHPPADACDFARFCSDLDFWSINDHATGITPEHWAETKEAIRRCNEVAGDPADPDLVTFLGWEWTQSGRSPDNHWGHKNVILRHTDEERIPARPIAAPRDLLNFALAPMAWWQRLLIPLYDLSHAGRYLDFGHYQDEVQAVRYCDDGVDTRELPNDCIEVAEDPGVLFEKLAQWGHEAIVIPHGTTWGIYSPPGSSIDKQLTREQHDPELQTLIEVFSGHGNSEEYRDWVEYETDANGEPVCPEPQPDYLPCCWRAGEIIRSRCGDVPDDVCERRVVDARRFYLEAGLRGHYTVPGAHSDEWLDCAQCRDCFQGAFNYRPRGSAQYAMALTNFDVPNEKRRFRFGFMASSDIHTGRPGTGYKEYDRPQMTESRGPANERSVGLIVGKAVEPVAEPVQWDRAVDYSTTAQLAERERATSFFVTGGLVAVHAAGRSRDDIWNSLERREVYGTSGGRMLLWFDLVNGPSGERAMGSEVEMSQVPELRVRAMGSFEQMPGCPDYSLGALGPERLQWLCRGECYNPSPERRRITRIEVVRIRPQESPGEAVIDLVDDPWRAHDCDGSRAGCTASFRDDEFPGSGREAIYYARAIEEPMEMINAAGLRCDYDDEGNCVSVNPCFSMDVDNDCLAEDEPRAWSSPIFVRPRAN
ncbi:MAG: DUF3604 domain-containing protein [Deltaproteobacteria bacterium]